MLKVNKNTHIQKSNSHLAQFELVVGKALSSTVLVLVNYYIGFQIPFDCYLLITAQICTMQWQFLKSKMTQFQNKKWNVVEKLNAVYVCIEKKLIIMEV